MNNLLPFVDFNYQLKKKGVSLFGIGEIAKETLKHYSLKDIDKIYDNSRNIQGNNFENIKIKNPKIISKNEFIIITSTSFSEISKQLIKKKLEPYKNFIISPFLNSKKNIHELENLKTTLIFTSGAPPQCE